MGVKLHSWSESIFSNASFFLSDQPPLWDSFLCTDLTFFFGGGGVAVMTKLCENRKRRRACKCTLQWYPLESWRCFRNMASDCEGDSDRVFDKHSADTFPPRKGLTGRQPSLWAAPPCAYESRELGGLSISGRFGVRPEKSSSPVSVSKSETLSAGRSPPAAASHAQWHLLFDSCAKTSSIRRLATKQTRMLFCVQSVCLGLILTLCAF